MEAVERFEHAGHMVSIYYDPDPLNPRKDWDPACTMVCFHGRYNLPNEAPQYLTEDYYSWEEMKAAIVKNEDVAAMLPVFMLDHSGLAFRTTSFNDPWDSGQVGFIYITKAKVRETQMCKRVTADRRRWAERACVWEVQEYDDFQRGNCYGFVVDEGTEQEDSCWGFLGDDGKEDAIQEAKSIAESMTKEAA